jgi:hypothetical protein
MSEKEREDFEGEPGRVDIESSTLRTILNESTVEE